MTQAKEHKCYDCNAQAVAFWPVVDPDIPSYPYCRKCLDVRKHRLMKQLLEDDK